MKNLMASFALTCAALSAGTCLAQTAAAAPATSNASAYPVAAAPGLYQAFGELQGLRTLMDDFVQRLKADARIGDQFRNTSAERLSQLLTLQLCQLSGGPCTYEGRDMKAAHAGMNISKAHFNALVEVLQDTMNARGIPFARQNQMLALLAPMYRDMVAP